MEENKEKEVANKKTPVIKGEVTVKKKSKARAMADSLIANEVSEIKDHVVFDIFLPSLKDFIHEATVTIIDMLLWGKDGNRGGIRRPNKGSSTYYSYNQPNVSYYNAPYRNYTQPQNRRAGAGGYNRPRNRSVLDLEYHSFDDAQNVIYQLNDTIANYGMATLADFYEYSGLPSQWNDCEWGWYDVSTAKVKASNGAWIITGLAKPIFVKD